MFKKIIILAMRNVNLDCKGANIVQLNYAGNLNALQ